MTKSELDSKLYAFFDAHQSAETHKRLAAEYEAKALPVWDDLHDALFEVMKPGEVLSHYKGSIFKPIGSHRLQIVRELRTEDVASRFPEPLPEAAPVRADESVDVEFTETDDELAEIKRLKPTPMATIQQRPY